MIIIQRDQTAPQFKNTPYTAQIDENIKVGSVVQTKPADIKATDDDKKVDNSFDLRLNFCFTYKY